MNTKKFFSSTMITAVALLGFAASGLMAESRTDAKITVSHGFVAGEKAFPAGTYILKSDQQNTMITIVSEDKKSQATLSGRAIDREVQSGETKVTFHRYGDQYFLNRVAIAGAHSETEMPVWTPERRARSSQGQPTEVTLAAQY